jgi:transcriptional regulator with XRE-family HTH domain
MDKDALAAFLRSRREQLRPEDVGLPRGSRRRTPGLRREEVAQLAHISTDHYSRLEQARGRHPSRQVLLGIARALRLSDQERVHLFSLAGELDHAPGRQPTRDVAPSTAALLDRLADMPALVVDNTCQVIAWNPLAAALFEDFSALRPPDRNILRRIFLGAGGEPGQGRGAVYGVTDPERFMTSAVSYLRLATTRYPDSAELHSLIAELLAGSAEFARLWNSQELRIEHHARQVFHHPRVGPIELSFDILTLPDRDQQLMLYTADPDSPAYRTLQLLKVIGTQRMDARA